MPPSSNEAICNRLLRALSTDDCHAVLTRSERVALTRKSLLIVPDRPIADILFIESGVVSEVVVTPGGRRVEIGIVGSEGFVGVPALLDVDTTPHEVSVHVEGEALRLDSAVFRDLLDRHPDLRRLLMRYAHVFQLQTAETAVSNGIRSLEERLARWLLMCHDRIGDNEFPITHEAMSTMLGVRRPGVTTALHVLEGAGIVKGRRSHLQILDREKLLSAAGESYGVPEREYRRLIGESL